MRKDPVKISHAFSVDLAVYPLEAIYGAAYVFVDRVYIFLSLAKKDVVMVTMTAKEETTKGKLANIEGEFQNELLNASLRMTLAKNNKKIRQHIIERALFSSIGEEDVWAEDDQVDIAMPWEEKNK